MTTQTPFNPFNTFNPINPFNQNSKSLEEQERELLEQIKTVFIPDFSSEDTTMVSEDTTMVSEDTTMVSEDTTMASEDTAVASEDTTMDIDDYSPDFTDSPTITVPSGLEVSQMNKLIALMIAAGELFPDKVIFRIERFRIEGDEEIANTFVRTIYYKDIDKATKTPAQHNSSVTTTELQKDITHMNSSPKGNFFIRNPKLKNNCVVILEAKRDLRLCNLSILSLLFGISIKNGKSKEKDNLRGLFSQFSYSNIKSACRKLGLDGIIIFDTVDLWEFYNSEEYPFPGGPEDKLRADLECLEDAKQRIAVPLFTKEESSLNCIGVLYPEIVLISKEHGNLTELLKVKYVRSIDSFYKEEKYRHKNFIKPLHFRYPHTQQFLIPPLEGSHHKYRINPEYNERITLINEVFEEQFYTFPYLYDQKTNILRLRQFIDRYTVVLSVIVHSHDGSHAGGNSEKTIKIKASKSRRRKLYQNKYKKTKRNKK